MQYLIFLFKFSSNYEDDFEADDDESPKTTPKSEPMKVNDIKTDTSKSKQAEQSDKKAPVAKDDDIYNFENSEDLGY